MAKNYYDILGVSKDASKDDIKKAFRKLAHEHHPDKKGGDGAKFKEASEAYAVLSDDQKRQQYDAYGSSGPGSPGGGFGGFNPNDFGGFDFSGFNQGGGVEFDLGSMFNDFFGGGGGRSKVRKGKDVSIDIELTFEESIFGVEKTVSINKKSACKTCHGTGGKPGTEVNTCGTCQGKGKVREVKQSFFGSVQVTNTCPTCAGSGKIPKEKCTICHGSGVTQGKEDIFFKVPAGIENGEMIRMTGAGEAESGGIAGDLYIRVHVKNNTHLRKEGTHLITDIKIKLSLALLGGDYQLKTLDGDITLKIPTGITHGEVLRVKGKGVPVDKKHRGDLLVQVFVDTPTKLSKTAKNLIEQLQKEGL